MLFIGKKPGGRSIMISNGFYNKLERLSVQAGKKDKTLAAHVQRIREAHDTVMRSYYQQIHRSSGADATTSMQCLKQLLRIFGPELIH